MKQQRSSSNNSLFARLAARETRGHRAGAAVHTVRAFYSSLHPTASVSCQDSPAVHFCRFTPDGQYLVCFASAGQELVVFQVKQLSVVRKPEQGATGPLGCCQARCGGRCRCACCGGEEKAVVPSSFGSFFQLLYRRVVVTDAREQLCKDFCLTTTGGRFLLLASQTSTSAAPEPQAPGQPQAQAQAQAQAQQGWDSVRAEEPATEVAGVPCVESTTLHLVRLEDGEHLDSVTFRQDFFHLCNNNGVSLHQDLLAVLAIRSQTTHIVQILKSGHLVLVSSIGAQCQGDDALALRTAEVAETSWQAGRSGQSTQREGCVASSSFPGARGAVASVGVRPSTGGEVVVRPGVGGTGAAGPQRALQANQPLGQVPAGDQRQAERQRQVQRVADRQRQVQQLTTAGLNHRRRPAAATPAAAPGRRPAPAQGAALRRRLLEQPNVAAAAAAAASAPPPAPGMVVGLKQRLLAHIFKSRLLRGGSSPRRQQQELRWFYRNFDAYSALVVLRCFFLSSTHLLMELDSMGPSDAPGQPAVPQHCLYFMVYDLEATQVACFFKGTSDKLLALLLSYASYLQADPGAPEWDRVAFSDAHAALLAEALQGKRASAAAAAAAPAAAAPGSGLGPSGGAARVDGPSQPQPDNLGLLSKFLAAVPITCQAMCSNPLLDPRLYLYDDKMISPLIKHRPYSEQPIKFFSRSCGNKAAFKLELQPPPGAEPGGAPGPRAQGRRAVLHLLHPVLPLLLSAVQGPAQPTQVYLHTWPL